MITDYTVGEKIVITEENIKIMKNSNHSCCTPNYPSDNFIAKAEELVGVIGEVTHRFRPGYELTANFDGHAFHMNDSWVTKL